MKKWCLTHMKVASLIALALLFGGSMLVFSAAPIGYEVSYQGFLKDNNSQANGVYDFRFLVFDVAESEFAQPLVETTQDNVTVTRGLINTSLNFNKNVFTGEERWLEIRVRPGNSTGAYTTLQPRQKLTSTPHAQYSLLAQSAVNATTAANGVPAGTVLPFAGSTPPAGYFLCDGHAISRTEYAALFAALQITYGGGDGVNTFNLPDLRGRVPVGAGKGTGLTSRTLAVKSGEEDHTLTIAEMPSHNHVYNDYYWRDTGNDPDYSNPTGNGSGQRVSVDRTSQDRGDGQPHNNMQPYIVLNYIIKY